MTEESDSAGGGLADLLVGVPEAAYGEHHKGHILELYRTYVEMADRISQRRERANAFFLAVQTSLVAYGSRGSGSSSVPPEATVVVAVMGVVLSVVWARMIRSYRDLNSAKFKVVHAIERHLPLRPYDSEWEAVGRGKNPKLYLPFTHIEGVVPWLFACLHLALAVAVVPWDKVGAWLKWLTAR